MPRRGVASFPAHLAHLRLLRPPSPRPEEGSGGSGRGRPGGNPLDGRGVIPKRGGRSSSSSSASLSAASVAAVGRAGQGRHHRRRLRRRRRGGREDGRSRESGGGGLEGPAAVGPARRESRHGEEMRWGEGVLKKAPRSRLGGGDSESEGGVRGVSRRGGTWLLRCWGERWGCCGRSRGGEGVGGKGMNA